MTATRHIPQIGAKCHRNEIPAKTAMPLSCSIRSTNLRIPAESATAFQPHHSKNEIPAKTAMSAGSLTLFAHGEEMAIRFSISGKNGNRYASSLPPPLRSLR